MTFGRLSGILPFPIADHPYVIIDSSTRGDIVAWLRLTLVPGVSASVQRALLKQFGSPGGVLRANASEVAAHANDPLVPERLRAGPDAKLLERTLAWLERHDCHLLMLGEAAYPAALLDLHDPPTVLYARGRIEKLNVPMFGIVGSRNATAQGTRDARAFARSLSEAGLCIVSGLALGIDAAAHRGGLEGAGGSVAVMGTGPETIYPRRNRDLAHAIAAGGCLVTEFPIGIASVPGNFPRRNRLISGLSKGVLVVEAALKSGSLSTAASALEQNREVFALPGSVHSPLSRGCHWLIKEGAKLVETADDILCEIKWKATRTPAGASRPKPESDPLLIAMGREPVSFDEVAARTGMGAGPLAARLSCLQVEGRIAALPGGRFQRLEAQAIE